LQEAAVGVDDAPVLALRSLFPESTFASDQYETLAPNGNGLHDGLIPALCTRAHARVVVTLEPDRFPEAQLKPLDLEAQHPDEFLCYLLEESPPTMLQVLTELAADMRDPPKTLLQVLELLGKVAPHFVDEILYLLPPDMRSPG
jgi:hypothetical protein